MAVKTVRRNISSELFENFSYLFSLWSTLKQCRVWNDEIFIVPDLETYGSVDKYCTTQFPSTYDNYDGAIGDGSHTSKKYKFVKFSHNRVSLIYLVTHDVLAKESRTSNTPQR